MATTIIKQVEFPLIDTTQPRPLFPDPYANVLFGGDVNGDLVIWDETIPDWRLATLAEQIQNVPNYITNPTNVFYSESDSNADLIDLRFLHKEVLKFELNGIDSYEGNEYDKSLDEDTISMNPPNTLSPNTKYLITID